MGRISGSGINVVEDVAVLGGKVEFMQNNTVSISGSSNVIVGDNNKISVANHLDALGREVDKSNASPEDKAEVKGLLRRIVEHPLVVAIAGGSVGIIGG